MKPSGAGPLSLLVLLVAAPAWAQFLEAMPADVVGTQSAELASNAETSEVAVTRGVAAGLDLGIVSPWPVVENEQPHTGANAFVIRRLLHAGSLHGGLGPSISLATSSTSRFDEAPDLTLALSGATKWFAWHANLGRERDWFSLARVEGPLAWRLRPALELRTQRFNADAVGIGALLQASDQIALDAGARITHEGSTTFGAGLTYLLPATNLVESTRSPK